MKLSDEGRKADRSLLELTPSQYIAITGEVTGA